MTAVDTAQRTLLEEASDWRLIGLLLECPRPGWIELIEALAAATADADLKEAAAAVKDEAAEGVYHSIFGPGGPAPPREVTYQRGVEYGHLMSELMAHYNAFSYAPQTEEVIDHVSVISGFVAYLKMKQAYALACGEDEAASVTADAARDFIATHVARVAEPLAASLGASGVAYLAAAGRSLFRRTGPQPRPVFDVLEDGLSASFGEEAEFDCGLDT